MKIRQTILRSITGIMPVVAEEDVTDSDKEGLIGRILPIRNHLYRDSNRHPNLRPAQRAIFGCYGQRLAQRGGYSHEHQTKRSCRGLVVARQLILFALDSMV